MSKQNRKRKISPTPEDAELIPTKEKTRPNDDPELGQLSRMLFGDSKAFLRSLEEAEHETAGPSGEAEFSFSNHPDSGIDGGSSEDSDEIDHRKPAWSDEEDEGIEVGEALDAQNRKLPSGGLHDRKNKYSTLVKHKFMSIVGTPKWAKLRKHADNEEILKTAGFINKTAKQTSLPATSLEFKKVKDLNSETYTEGPFINSIEFHPTSSVGLVAGSKGIATLFAVDGKKNNKLHSVAFEKFPILCAKFSRNGDEALLGSRQGHIFSYDLIAAKAMRYNLPPGMTQCKNFTVSPDSQFFAVAGKWGEVHILSTISKEKIATLKQDNDVRALEYNSNGNLLFGHSDTGEVTIWDINMRRVRHKFIDEGCLQGSTLSASMSNQFLACGSAQGIVNLYGMDDVLKSKVPKPRKTIMNLKTAVTSLKFNSSSEMLALAATDIKNSVKLFHLASGTVFSNFPPFESKLGQVNCLNFTPGSGYLALGNRKSVVSLFRLKYFKNY
ncbi:unnamed protein product [Ceutorhynchus assimilis]|uniref:U3 small nucleolar RNA-associated protein 18 homolog n=1 Tax=Ceutorhynchus assimilis TaxID=467358 RepID=A0A9N9QBA6_9CUCU|nr:unnamed protein product [Ceutorhynchus assimilis]